MVNILPINDLKEHEENTTCDCNPKVEILENGEILVIHNSYDRREVTEEALELINKLKIIDIEKQFIPYEQSLALKELGFDEKCFGAFNKDITIDLALYLSQHDAYSLRAERVLAPLWQQAFDWFRENHKLNSFIYTPIDKINYCFEIKNILEFINDGDLSEMQSGIKYTYEEARLECLKKLIEIVKNK